MYPQRYSTDRTTKSQANFNATLRQQFFFAQTSLLAPYRPTRGMLVARAESERQIPCRECIVYFLTDPYCLAAQIHQGFAEVRKAELKAGCG